MLDIVIAVMPFCKPDLAGGPPQLKSYVEQYGFNCKVVDWNIDLYIKMGKDYFDSKESILNIFQSRESMLNPVNELKTLWDESIDKISDDWINEIEKLNPRFLGLSCFTFLRTRDLVILFLEKIRKKLPNLKIIIGGHAVSCEVGMALEIHNFKFISLGEELLYKKLIDFYINGEGEIPLLKLLNGDYICDGLNNNKVSRITDLDTLPYADFSDLDFSKYPDVKLPVFFSRGCVNNCKFCFKIIKKYFTKNPKDFAEELIYYSKLYNNIEQFVFTDYLVSGNRKKYIELIDELYNLKINKKYDPVIWMAMHFIWPKSYINEDTFYKMKQCGCYVYIVGLESGSEKVRLDMGKHIKDSSLDFTVEQCFKNEILIILLLIIGYITETEEDFQKTLDLLDRYEPYKTFLSITLGSTYYISKKSKKIHEDEGLEITFDDDGHWIYKDNTIEVRLDRWFRMRDKCISLGYTIDDFNNNSYMENLNNNINNK